MALKRQGVLAGTYGTPAEEKKQAAKAPKNDTDVASSVDTTPSVNEPRSPSPEPALASSGPQTEPFEDEPASAAASGPIRPSAPVGSAPPSAANPTPLRTVARTRRAQQRDDELAREAVTEAYTSAKRRPKEWTTTAIRLAAPVKERLAQRRALDEEAFDVKFAETHYIDAALSRIPDDPEVAIAWANEYLDSLGLKAPETTGTTGRVRQVTASHLASVFRKMRQQARYGLNGHLQTAAVTRLLDALDRRDAELQAQGSVVDLD